MFFLLFLKSVFLPLDSCDYTRTVTTDSRFVFVEVFIYFFHTDVFIVVVNSVEIDFSVVLGSTFRMFIADNPSFSGNWPY